MNTRQTSRVTKRVSGLAFLGVSLCVLVSGSTSALAVDCDNVRALTKVEQNYWAKRLNLTADERHRIWQACYGRHGNGQHGIREANGERLRRVTDQR